MGRILIKLSTDRHLTVSVLRYTQHMSKRIIKHGTYNEYHNHGCRCKLCKAANAERQREFSTENQCCWYQCKNKGYSHGLCRNHYNKASLLVKQKIRTWEELENGGYAVKQRYPRTQKNKIRKIKHKENKKKTHLSYSDYLQDDRKTAFLKFCIARIKDPRHLKYFGKERD